MCYSLCGNAALLDWKCALQRQGLDHKSLSGMSNSRHPTLQSPLAIHSSSSDHCLLHHADLRQGKRSHYHSGALTPVNKRPQSEGKEACRDAHHLGGALHRMLAGI